MAFKGIRSFFGQGNAVLLAYALSGMVITASALTASINPTNGGLAPFVFSSANQSLSANLGDTFTSVSSSTTNFSFVDVYSFATTDATAYADVISLKLSNVTNLSNLAIAMFSASSIANGSNIYAGSAFPTATGTVVSGGAWSKDYTTVAGPNTIVSLTDVMLPTGTYYLQVRGTGTLAAASQASYGGTLSLISLPEPQGALLTLAGLGGIAILALARRRSR